MSLNYHLLSGFESAHRIQSFTDDLPDDYEFSFFAPDRLSVSLGDYSFLLTFSRKSGRAYLIRSVLYTPTRSLSLRISNSVTQTLSATFSRNLRLVGIHLASQSLALEVFDILHDLYTCFSR